MGSGRCPFAWGDEAYPGGIAQANSWLGRFPYDNQGVGGTAPVGSYPPNGYGLYDMIANVWEWTTDFYTPRHLRLSDAPVDPGKRTNLLAAASAQEGFPRHPASGAQGRIAPLLARLLPALPPGRALAAGRGHRHVAHRIPPHPF